LKVANSYIAIRVNNFLCNKYNMIKHKKIAMSNFLHAYGFDS